MTDTVIFKTSGTSMSTPADWNNAANNVQAIGEGGNGFTIASAVSGSGGGGGAYAKATNITLSGTIAYQIGTGGSSTTTQFKDGSTLVADYGRAPTVFSAGGAAGLDTNCVGGVKTNGGPGGNGGGGKYGGGG